MPDFGNIDIEVSLISSPIPDEPSPLAVGNFNHLQFDVVKWHGQPFEEIISLELFFDEESGMLENYSAYEDFD